MIKLSTPSAVPLTWAVRRPNKFILSLRQCGQLPEKLLGYVSDCMWFEARRKACVEFGVGPEEIELEPIGPTVELPPLPRPDGLLVAPRVVQDKSKLRKVRRKNRRQ